MAVTREAGSSRGYPHAWVIAAVALLAVAAVLTWGMGWGSYERPFWATHIDEAQPPWLPTPNNTLYVCVTLALWAIGCALVALRPGNGWRPSGRQWLLVPALLTTGLGLASFVPCQGSASWIGPLMWTINLFGGNLETDSIGPSSALESCASELPLALQMARLTGVLTLAGAALALLWATSRHGWDRLWAWASVDKDIVIGVNAESLPLIQALIAERRAPKPTSSWSKRTFFERVGDRPRLWRPGVLVVRTDREDELLVDAERLGAHVVTGDPTSVETWTRLLNHPWRNRLQRQLVGRLPATQLLFRRPVKRAFAVSHSQSENAAVVAALRAAMETSGEAPPGPGDQIPRLIARFDDPRAARDWRIAQLDSNSCFVDAVSTDELLAREIVERVRRHAPEVVIVSGDTPLTIALLSEFRLRESFGVDMSSASLSHGPGVIVIAHPHAAAIVREWSRDAAPAQAPKPFDVLPTSMTWERLVGRFAKSGSASLHTVSTLLAARRTLALGPRPFAIISTDEYGSATIAQARRLTNLYSQALVVCRDPHMRGVHDAHGADRIVGYGPTLLRQGGAPEDSWTVLARHNHEAYASTSGVRPANRPWGKPSDHADDRLPEFFREDNLRQVRTVLQQLQRCGYRWRPAAQGCGTEPLDDIVDILTDAEHRRWVDSRRIRGWTWHEHNGATQEERAEDDRLRKNRSMVDLDTGERFGGIGVEPLASRVLLRNADAGNVRDILKRLRWMGIEPVQAYRRRGFARAQQLTSARAWVTSSGYTITSGPGDWWVTDEDDPDGNFGRAVDERFFSRTYREVVTDPTPADHDRGKLYERIGVVTALPATGNETVRTDGSTAVPHEGDWIVSDEDGAPWIVPVARFEEQYEKMPAMLPAPHFGTGTFPAIRSIRARRPTVAVSPGTAPLWNAATWLPFERIVERRPTPVHENQSGNMQRPKSGPHVTTATPAEPNQPDEIQTSDPVRIEACLRLAGLKPAGRRGVARKAFEGWQILNPAQGPAVESAETFSATHRPTVPLNPAVIQELTALMDKEAMEVARRKHWKFR